VKSVRRHTWTAFTAALLGAATALGAVVPALAATRWGADYFPNVPLITHEGSTVRFYDDVLKGKAVAINTIYTTCKDECPLETAKLVQLQRVLGDRVGKDIFFYSISIDPARDTPEALKAYAQRFQVGPGWLFLTGNEENIRLVVKKLGLSRRRDAATRDGHSAILMLGDVPHGQWMRNSAVDDTQFLAKTIANFLGWRDGKAGMSYTNARPLNLHKGAYVFRSRCSACHTIGKGDGVGPDLAGITTRRDRDWLARYLKEPDRVLSEGDPIATALVAKYKNIAMPNLRLDHEEIAAVLSFLENLGHGPTTGR
jgi:protein SCO1/2